MILSGAHSDHQMTQELAAATHAVDRVRIGELAPPTEHRSTRQNHGTVLATKAQNGTSVALVRSTHDVEPDFRKSDPTIQSRQSALLTFVAAAMFGLDVMFLRFLCRCHPGSKRVCLDERARWPSLGRL